MFVYEYPLPHRFHSSSVTTLLQHFVSSAFMRLALLPAFVHAFGTVGTIEPCKLVGPASTQIDFEEFTRASWFVQEQASEGSVAC